MADTIDQNFRQKGKQTKNTGRIEEHRSPRAMMEKR